MVRQGAGWQQQGRPTTAVQDVGQQLMGRQQPSCREQGSQHTGRRQGSQMGRVQRQVQVTGRHTVVWQLTGRQQQGSRQQQGWQQEGWQHSVPQPWEEQMEPQQEPDMVMCGAV